MRKFLSPFFILFVAISVFGQNVGIGTTEPITKLDVNSTNNYVARFNAPFQTFIGISENNFLRGYFGSFSGAIEDVDLGTSTGNTNGSLHLTTKAQPRLTINPDGKIGIGLVNPSEKLDLSGNMKLTGEIMPNGSSGAAGQVLTSNGDGSMQWAENQEAEEVIEGAGTWGDCSVNNIEAYFPVALDDGEFFDYFGTSVAISGDYAIVGAHFYDETGFMDNGNAFIYKRNANSGEWLQHQTLSNINVQNGDGFGNTVAISGDFAIVSAVYDNELGLTKNGSATIFKRNAATDIWEPKQKLTNPDVGSNEYFGWGVAISGDYAVVSSPYDDQGGKLNNGSATIFKRDPATELWASQGLLTDPGSADNDNFGYSVSISGEYAIVGVPNDSENGKSQNGSASIFKLNPISRVWDFQQKLVNISPQDNDFFGRSVSISGDFAIVGAIQDDEEGFIDNGSATVFKRNATTSVWASQRKIVNKESQDNDHFGNSVCISGEYAMVTADSDNENGYNDNGSVSIYHRFGNIWKDVQKFSDPLGADFIKFGYSAAIDGATLRFIVGEPSVQGSTGMVFFGKVK